MVKSFRLHWKGSIIKKDSFPHVDIYLKRIAHNLSVLLERYGALGIQISPVAKGVCGSIEIAKLFSRFDIHSIGDSHLRNIQKMKEAGIKSKFMLMRSPMLSEAEDIVLNADISLNSELAIIRALDQFAAKHKKTHDIILMIELGDLREGIFPEQIDEYLNQINKLKNIRLIGIGTNLTCLNGIKPTVEKMDTLSSIAVQIQDKYGMDLELISGGNSANYQWTLEAKKTDEINHLRIGESILLGTDPISRKKIPGLMDYTFILTAEVIESKRKPSKPIGIITYDAFGELPAVKDEGEINRSLIAIGLQDVDHKGCTPIDPKLKILGATSDHLVIKSTGKILPIGKPVSFKLTYRALLRLMISSYVEKRYVS